MSVKWFLFSTYYLHVSVLNNLKVIDNDNILCYSIQYGWTMDNIIMLHESWILLEKMHLPIPTFWENHGNKSRTHPTEAGQCRDLKHIKEENN